MRKKFIEGSRNVNTTRKILCLCGYLIVFLFFVLLYFLMTETYEDISQYNSGAGMSVPGILVYVYNYIPRLGEFFQRIAVHFMTPQLSLGSDLVLRIVIALFASGVIYVSAVFVLGRRLRLQYKDLIVTLGMLIFFMLSIFSEIFTYRFSYVNNYVLGLFVMISFLTIFRIKNSQNKWYKDLGAILLGFAFGISTEIAPVIFIVLVVVWVSVLLIQRKMSWKDFFGRYQLQTFAVIGLILGLMFFYLGGGLESRTGGGYAEVYDYVSPMDIFSDFAGTIDRLYQHFWYNIRYIFFAIPLMVLYVLLEFTVFKRTRGSFGVWQTMLLCFCILFVGVTSLIAVHDDLYPRFMVPVFLVIMLSTFILVVQILDFAAIKEERIKRVVIILLGIGVVLVLDMAVAFYDYKILVGSKLEAIHYNPGNDLIIDNVENADMKPSKVFRLKQLTPFDWGPDIKYTKFGL